MIPPELADELWADETTRRALLVARVARGLRERGLIGGGTQPQARP